MSEFTALKEEICVLQPLNLSEEDFKDRLMEWQKYQQDNNIDFNGMRNILLDNNIEIISVKLTPLEEMNNNVYYETMPLKTTLSIESDKLDTSSEYIKNNDTVFTCSLGKYSIEIKYEDGYFKETIMIDGIEDISFWLSGTILSIENCWKDILSTFKENEGIHINLKYINQKQTIWLLRRYKKILGKYLDY